MATYPARRDLFWKSARSIASQVDRMFIVLNEYTEVPTIPDVLPNVDFILPGRDLKDLGKFRPEFGDEDMVFLADDDIIYPPDYVVRTLERISSVSSDSRCAYGYHGTRYLPASFDGSLESAIGSFKHKIYRGRLRKLRTSFFYENGLETPQIVDQLGSGVAVLKGSDLPSFDFMDGSRQFVDVRMALWCHNNDIACVCLPREAGWLTTQSTDESIYKSFTRRTPIHVRDEIYRFAGGWASKTLASGNRGREFESQRSDQ